MRVVAEVPPSEVVLEEALALDRLRKQRMIAAVFLGLCIAGAAILYAAYVDWPAPIRTADGKVLELELTFAGWLQTMWMVLLIGGVGLVNLVRVVLLTRAIGRLRG
jgi:hypothetical protein